MGMVRTIIIKYVDVRFIIQVRAVTDLGAVSALTRALSRMDLTHSRAPACGAALVRPLEMFTR